MEALDPSALNQDSASLLRFVTTVVASTFARSDYPSYLKPSDDFFDSIRKLGDATADFLDAFPTNSPRNTTLHFDYRRKLTTLRQGWTALHEYVKPALEAHTLGIPSPFIEALIYRFHQLPQFKDSSFALIHTNEVMYYQLRASWIRDKIKEIAQLVGIKSPFPDDLGIIALPYSQSGSLFLNTAIAHEIGHFAFQKLQLRDQIAVDVVTEIQGALAANTGNIKQDATPNNLIWMIETALKWAEELYCDLFAIWLVGPCFSLSYIELFDLGYAMETLDTRRPFLDFYSTHPSTLLRLQQHRVLLEHLGWWTTFGVVESHYIALLNKCQSLKEEDFGISAEKGVIVGTATRSIFFKIVSSLHNRVNSLFSGFESGAEEFEELAPTVEQYFWNGIVPSTVFHSDNLLRYPRVSTLLNTAAKVHISSLDKLLNRVDKGDVASPKSRAEWTARLELWTIKALEDSVILERTGRRWDN